MPTNPLCNTCHKRPPAPNRKGCPVCLKMYREAWRKRAAARKAKGLCLRCGKQAARPERTQCADCAARHAAKYDAKDRERVSKRYWARVAAGLCTKCGKAAPEPERRTCPPCGEKDRARDQSVRRSRRANELCTKCGKPSMGAWLCPVCAKKMRHYKTRWESSPNWPPTYTVYDRLTGESLGTFDSREDVALCLAFAKLDRDAVEIVTDAPAIAGLTGWN